MQRYLLPLWLDENGAVTPGQTWPQGKRGDWYCLGDRDCRLHKEIGSILRVMAATRPDVDILYGDEVETAGDCANIPAPAAGHPATASSPAPAVAERFILKPGFDITQLIAQNYIGWPLFIRGDSLARLAPSPAQTHVTAYDLLLRAHAAGMMIERIPEIISVRTTPRPPEDVADHTRAVNRWIEQRLDNAQVLPGRLAGTLRLHRTLEDPPHVTLVIPTRQTPCKVGEPPQRGRPMILNLLESLTRSSWPMDRLTVLVGDDVENDAIYAGRDWPFTFERVVTTRAPGEPFNYAAKINALWRMAKSEYLILLNDDVVVRHPDWIEAMMSFACEEDVGGVGARLLYPDGRIQHAGMAGGVMGTCTHVFIGQPGDAPSYQNWADVHRECSMVTGAAFATRRSLLDRLNGLDEQFALDWNDVDLCLRMRLLGLRIIYTPHAELTHYESASRGSNNLPGADLSLFLERWNELLRNDPAYNPGLVRNSPLTEPAPLSYKGWWRS